MGRESVSLSWAGFLLRRGKPRRLRWERSASLPPGASSPAGCAFHSDVLASRLAPLPSLAALASPPAGQTD